MKFEVVTKLCLSYLLLLSRQTSILYSFNLLYRRTQSFFIYLCYVLFFWLKVSHVLVLAEQLLLKVLLPLEGNLTVMKLWLSPRTFVCKERYDQESISFWGINVCTTDIIHLKSKKKKLFLSPVHAYTDIFESATFSLRIQKFPHPHLSVFKSNLPVHTYPTRIWIHSSCQDSSGNIGNRACVEVAILNTVFTVKDWAQSCYVTG